MSLRFYFGPSGAGKSCRLYREIIERSQREPRKNFLIVVPDQFTMQTQKDIVSLHEREGILNIDVLSFGRLSHRILEEVGGENVPVLDDTGKSLVLQRVAAGLRDRLPVLGGQLQRQGYIHEVKSALSEFMQYGISPQGVEQLAEFSGKRGALQGKLRDLELLYQSFLDYIRGHFITAEETLDRLCRVLHRSRLVPGSVVAFDGFTGFTPIQNRLIQRLMSLAQEVIVTVTLGEGEDPYHLDGEQKLFHLSKKTVHDLEKLADEAAVPRGQDVFVGGEVSPRFQDSPALQSLEALSRQAGEYPDPGGSQSPHGGPQGRAGDFEAGPGGGAGIPGRGGDHRRSGGVRPLRGIGVCGYGDPLLCGPDPGHLLKSHDRIYQERPAAVFKGFFL